MSDHVPARKAAVACRATSWLILGAVAAVALLGRLPQSDEGLNLTWCDPDSLFQLHRVQQTLDSYPRVPSFDSYCHFPDGLRVHWNAGLTLAYATIAAVSGMRDGTALVPLLAVIPPLLGVGAILLLMSLVYRWADRASLALAAGLAAAVGSGTVRPFLYGVIDHHAWTHIAVLLCVHAVTTRRWSAWCGGWLMLFSVTPAAPLYGTTVFGAELLSRALATPLSFLRRLPVWLLVPALAAAVSWAIQLLIDRTPLPMSTLRWSALTLFQPIWFGIMGGTGALLLLAREAGTRTESSRGPLPWLILVVGISLLLILLSFGGGIEGVLSRLSKTDRLFVVEEMSPVRNGIAAASSWVWLSLAAGLTEAIVAIRNVRLRRSAPEIFRPLILALAVAFCVTENRHSFAFGSLQIAAIVLAIHDLDALLRRFVPSGLRALPSVLLIVLAGGAFVHTNGLRPPDMAARQCVDFTDRVRLTTWLRHSTPPTVAEPDSPEYGVFPPWSFGHHVHVLGERPTVVDPFNAPVPIENRIRQVMKAMDVDALTRELDRYGARYLILVDPALSIVGVTPRAEWRHHWMTYTPTGVPVHQPAFERFASYRLHFLPDALLEGGTLQPRFLSQRLQAFWRSRGPDAPPSQARVSWARVFERKPGARASGRAPHEASEVEVAVTVEMPHGRAIARRRLPVAPDGTFELHTALPAPSTGAGIHVPGPYRVRAGQRQTTVTVTQEMVDRGAHIQIHWPEDESASSG